MIAFINVLATESNIVGQKLWKYHSALSYCYQQATGFNLKDAQFYGQLKHTFKTFTTGEYVVSEEKADVLPDESVAKLLINAKTDTIKQKQNLSQFVVRIYTGMRSAEIYEMTFANVSLGGNEVQITLPTSKNGKKVQKALPSVPNNTKLCPNSFVLWNTRHILSNSKLCFQ
ncbi:hypothetical protein FDP41_004897 [Naegleria fowleri]|uniref:Uncharacterized protein n=1 Tax=Naegleria fowleri TaxID=5763 RepID=A0A6A5BMW0_NAEFO|nr:uncharacterized protein FDP41_004897 [Naegleria fowleri]KAF0976222.1 hypothetical protein FDP41_004897 [Naegleria fowleri]